MTKDHGIVLAKLIIGKLVERVSLASNLFYVIVQVNERSASRRPSSSKHSNCALRRGSSLSASSNKSQLYCLEDDDDHGRIRGNKAASSDSTEPPESLLVDGEDLHAAEVYGLSSAFNVGSGLVPATERYAQATVLCMDIVDYTRHCVAKPLHEISGWMTRIHGAIDELLGRQRGRAWAWGLGDNFT